MRTVRGLTVVALTTVLALALIGILGTGVLSPPAAATTPHWQTTASYQPLTNVRAVSCATSISPSSATCVAVGDDGGQVASIIVTNDGGSTWSRSSPPVGVSTLSTVSCPSASVCYAGGGSGIMKSPDGGATWSVQDSGFPTESISCFTIDECTAVGGSRIVKDNGRVRPGILRHRPLDCNSLGSVSCSNAITVRSGRGCEFKPAIIGTQDGSTLDHTGSAIGPGVLFQCVLRIALRLAWLQELRQVEAPHHSDTVDSDTLDSSFIDP